MQNNWDAYLSGVLHDASSYTDRDAIRPFLSGKVLDVGCSFGSFGQWCVSLPEIEFFGLDPSPYAIEKAQHEIPKGDFRVASAESLPFEDGYFDVLTSFEVVEHLKEPEIFFKEAKRALKPGGHLIVQTPNYPIKRIYDFVYRLMGRKATFADDPTHVSPFTFARMKRVAKDAGFVVISLAGRNIMGEKRLPLLKRMKKGGLAGVFSQKMILIAQKKA